MLAALLFSALGCATRCPCVVPAGVDWRSAAVMAPRARQQAHAVFRGTVVRADTVALDTFNLARDGAQWPHQIVQVKEIRYTLSVDRVWKGPRKRELVLMSYGVHTSCGRDYTLGETYLVYADRDRQGTARARLITYSCSRVRSGVELEDDLKVLGPGRAPK